MCGTDELVLYQRQSGGASLDDSHLTSPREPGHPLVLHFGDAGAELQAARQDSVVFDVSDRSQIELAGKDARTFLHNFCTNDIKRLAPGTGCEAFMTNVKGRILAHFFAFATQESIWLDMSPAHEIAILAHLDRYIFSEEVTLHGRTGDFGDLYVSGPRSIDRLAQIGLPVGSLRAFEHTLAVVRELPLAVRRVDFWQAPGFLISTARQHLVGLWQALVAAAICPAGAQVFHSCRIQAGLPLSGLDVTDDNLAQEAARTERAISFTKGCYLGQEPIARLDALGHVNRQLCRLGLDTDWAPASGTAIVDGDDRPIGTLTSSAVVPGEGRTVALAMLRTSQSEAGTRVWLSANDRRITASVF